MARWDALRASLQRACPRGPRFATASQVHGTRVVEHDGAWEGWLRGDDADGHFAPRRGTAMAVTIADCVPVFIAHPVGRRRAAALGMARHGGAHRRARARRVQPRRACAAGDLRMHLGPAICGACYEVSADVATRAHRARRRADRSASICARSSPSTRARRGVHTITTSACCTRCDNDALLLASRRRRGPSARRDRRAHPMTRSGRLSLTSCLDCYYSVAEPQLRRGRNVGEVAPHFLFFVACELT